MHKHHDAISLGAAAVRHANDLEHSVSMSVDRSLRSVLESEATKRASENTIADVRARAAAELSNAKAEAAREREVLAERVRQAEWAAERLEKKAEAEIRSLRSQLVETRGGAPSDAPSVASSEAGGDFGPAL